jgi:hypothetical protein
MFFFWFLANFDFIPWFSFFCLTINWSIFIFIFPIKSIPIDIQENYFKNTFNCFFIVPDALQSSHPISTITNDPDVIVSNFDPISYDKGSAIIRMMANFIGTDTFDTGVEAFLNKFKFGNAAKVCPPQTWDHGQL